MVGVENAVSYIPQRGDIIWIDFDPQLGHEQKGHRPALVLTSKIYNQFGLVMICPITSKIKGFNSEVLIPTESKTKGAILIRQVHTKDWKQRKIKFVEQIPPSILSIVIERIESLLKY